MKSKNNKKGEKIMMNLKEMSESVAMRLQRDGYEAEVTSAMKNSVSKMAIVVNAGNDTVRPIFYTEDLMKCLDNVMDLDSMIEKMEDMIIKCLQQDNNSLDTNKSKIGHLSKTMFVFA